MNVRNCRRSLLPGLLSALLITAAATALAAGINTTNWNVPGPRGELQCKTVNQNQYAAKEDVGLNGSPSSLPTASAPYNLYVRVISPGGTVLGVPLGGQATLVVNADGSITCQQLWALVQKKSDSSQGYDDTVNGGGVYKVEVASDAAFKSDGSDGFYRKSDNFKVSNTAPPSGLTVTCPDDPAPVCASGDATPVKISMPSVTGGTPCGDDQHYNYTYLVTYPGATTPTPTTTLPTSFPVGVTVVEIDITDCTSGDQGGPFGAQCFVVVTVNALPIPTASNNGPVCAGGALSLIGGPDGMSVYSWTGPNGFTSSDQNPTVSASATTDMSGVYILTVTDANGCSNSTTTTAVVNALPSPTANNNGPVCEGGTLSLTGGPDNMKTYAWAGPNGFTSSDQNPTVSSSATADMAGVYTLTVTDGNGCSSSATTTVAVNPLPNCAFSGPAAVCAGSTGNTYTYTGTTTGSVGFAWSVTGDATIVGSSTGSSITVTAGTQPYTVGLTVTDKNFSTACQSSCSEDVNVISTIVNVHKFYDANADGADESQGATGLNGVTFTLKDAYGNVVASGATAGNGDIALSVPAVGTYVLAETLPSGWSETTGLLPKTILPTDFVASGGSPCQVSVSVGNVRRCAPANGKTIGFWSNSNGQSLLQKNDPAWRTLLNGLNLRNANGSSFTISTSATFTNAYGALKTWLNGASATNMAYMLSAQLAASKLNSLIIASNAGWQLEVPGCLRTLANYNVIAGLNGGLPANSVTGTGITQPLVVATVFPATCSGPCVNTIGGYDGIVAVGAIQSAAVTVLGSASGANTTASGAYRTYEECLKVLLDELNNNGTPTGSSAYNCPLLYIIGSGPSTCP